MHQSEDGQPAGDTTKDAENSKKDVADLARIEDLIASGDYNNDKLPPTIVPGLENVQREIPRDSFLERVEAHKKAEEQDGEQEKKPDE